jgi:hypothetical protein
LNTFQIGDEIIATGIPGNLIVVNGQAGTSTVKIASFGTGTGGVRTDNLSGAGGISISSPVPVLIRRVVGMSGFTIANFETEGCGVGVYVRNGGPNLNLSPRFSQLCMEPHGLLMSRRPE